MTGVDRRKSVVLYQHDVRCARVRGQVEGFPVIFQQQILECVLKAVPSFPVLVMKLKAGRVHPLDQADQFR
jgi:hypothetical protein